MELMIGKGLTEDPANLDKFDKFHSETFTWIWSSQNKLQEL